MALSSQTILTQPDFDSAMIEHFADQLLAWFDIHGRHDLPWQIKNDPYKVWVSEIMLQQTQVKTVLQYYTRFITRFPDVKSLAEADWDEVAPFWAGLGYYARARNLHKAAQQVMLLGDFPHDLDGWMALSGIGRSTAGAMMSLGLGQFGVILDGNVKRVLSRYFAISGDLSKPALEKHLWQLATQLAPDTRHSDYTQAIMDLGATICTPKKTLCLYCPMNQECLAYKQDNVLAFPEKKIKKTVPTRQAHVLILEHEQHTQSEYLWQQRPASGLWGGLYSLPILEEDKNFQAFLNHSRLIEQQQFMVVHHFTHFTWHLHCHHFKITSEAMTQYIDHFAHDLSSQTVTDAEPLSAKNTAKHPQQQKFLTAEQAIKAGIPTAMQKVLQHLKNDSNAT